MIDIRGRIIKRRNINFFKDWNPRKSRARRPFEFGYSDAEAKWTGTVLEPHIGGVVSRNGEIRKIKG